MMGSWPDPAAAQNVKCYLIVSPAGQRISMRSATYDPTNLTVTLHPSQRIRIQHPYKLVINGTGLDGINVTASRCKTFFAQRLSPLDNVWGDYEVQAFVDVRELGRCGVSLQVEHVHHRSQPAQGRGLRGFRSRGE
jgi:hypothetical protein